MGEGKSSSAGRRIQPFWKLSRFGIGIPSSVGRGQAEGRFGRNSLLSSTVLAQFLAEQSAGITNHEPRTTNHEARISERWRQSACRISSIAAGFSNEETSPGS